MYAADLTRAYSFNFSQTWLYGDPAARPDPNAKYRLPFRDGLSFRINQAPGGPLPTHDNVYSRDAVDITMPVGTPIVAARAGYVIMNIRPYDSGKLEPDFLDKANMVRVMHDDGTWADYVHLQKYSGIVVPGMRVEAGTPIGLSGSSGFSSGPHLHFVVQRNDGEKAVSVPFRFWNRADGVFAPVYQGMVAADYGDSTKSPATIQTVGAPLAPAAVKPKPRTVKECMGGKNVIDEAVLRCKQGL
jgi:murein DD-endopeptidase MepM/ murein hydrolase activator NlpD